MLRRKDEAPGDSGVLEGCILVTRLDHVELLSLLGEHFLEAQSSPPPPLLPNRRQQVWGEGCVPTPPWSLSPCGDRTTVSLSTGGAGSPR